MANSERIHGLDSLRAILMMLGVVIHSALAYFPPETPAWSFQDPYVGSEWSYLIVEFIHLFRMPAFFLISGFFGALLWTKRGPSKMASNRFSRIVLPLLIFLIPLSYLVDFADIYSGGLLSGDPEPFYLACGATINWLPTSTHHLWFLYYLALVTALQALSVALLQALKLREGRTHSFIQDMLARPWFFLVFMGLGSSLIAWVFSWGESIPTSDAWVPNVSILLYYWFWYQLGWGIYRAEASFRSFAKPAWGLLGSGALFWMLGMHWFASVAFIQASIGLFLRYADAPSARWRYLSDSAYWVYLLHLPFTILVPALIMDWPLPYVLKLSACIAIVVAICLLSYSAIVRTTLVGRFLNGRRYSHPKRRLGAAGFMLLGSGTVWAALHPPDVEDRPSPWRDTKFPDELLDEASGASLIYPFESAKKAGLSPRSCAELTPTASGPVLHLGGPKVFCLSFQNHQTATKTCEAMGAQLASLETIDEATTVRDWARTLSARPFYFGLSDLISEGDWIWASQKPLNDTDWADGEPNSWGGYEEDCAALNYEDLRGWIDLPCESEVALICEYPAGSTSG